MISSGVTALAGGISRFCRDGSVSEGSGEDHIVSKEKIAMLRRKALRKGVWFRVLSRAERGIVDLTLRYVEKIKSSTLTKVLRGILRKLSDAVEHFFTWRLEQIGRPLAEMMSEAASLWGNQEAKDWKKDTSYIQLLGLNKLSSNVRI